MKVSIETLGCKVNTYESEMIKNEFIQYNNIIVNLDENPDVVIINTCSVTNQSDAKSRKLIRKAKKLNKDSIIVVCGCSSQLHQEEMKELGIDILLGNKDKTSIVKYVNEYIKEKSPITKFYDLNKVSFEDMSLSYYTGRTRGFVKIQDGCNNYCTYCIIPYVRGNIRSKEFTSAIEEIKNLVANGFKEIVLTGINTGSYGYGTDNTIVTLIKEISKIEDLKRIRISSIEITEITDDFLDELKNNNKICDHLHIPIQNGDDEVLKKMNRKYNLKEYKEVINKIKAIRPNINITTDLIVGFPIEEEVNFLNTIKTVNDIKFGKIHVFPFSLRNGTAAELIKNVVTDASKKERSKTLISVSDNLEQEYMKQFLDKKLEVLIEEVKDGISIGHTSNYIKVLIEKELIPNEFYDVTIIEIDKDHVKAYN